MTWLARMHLSKETLGYCRFRDTYAWHQAVWDCFPHMPQARRDFLTRTDWLPQGCRLYLLCQSKPARPAWCPPESWGCKEISPSFLTHDAYGFDLLVNPTRKVASFTANGQQTRNGKRLALLDEGQRHAWLQSKGAQHGFCLDESAPLTIDEAGSQVFLRRTQPGTHIGVRFRGRLRVTERERFVQAFHKGIGSAKAFGFGMLVLQPLF